MLGPSMLIASPPFCTGYAFHTYRRSGPKFPAMFGLALAGVELFILAALTAMASYLAWVENSYAPPGS